MRVAAQLRCMRLRQRGCVGLSEIVRQREAQQGMLLELHKPHETLPVVRRHRQEATIGEEANGWETAEIISALQVMYKFILHAHHEWTDSLMPYFS